MLEPDGRGARLTHPVALNFEADIRAPNETLQNMTVATLEALSAERQDKAGAR
jgi:hypothetical protein